MGALFRGYSTINASNWYSALNMEVMDALSRSFLLSLLTRLSFLPQPSILWPWWFVSSLPKGV